MKEKQLLDLIKNRASLEENEAALLTAKKNMEEQICVLTEKNESMQEILKEISMEFSMKDEELLATKDELLLAQREMEEKLGSLAEKYETLQETLKETSNTCTMRQLHFIQSHHCIDLFLKCFVPILGYLIFNHIGTL